jgi:hypothetical protein
MGQLRKSISLQNSFPEDPKNQEADCGALFSRKTQIVKGTALIERLSEDLTQSLPCKNAEQRVECGIFCQLQE